MVQPPGDVVLDDWIDRDLSEAAAAGSLPPAFAVEEVIGQAEDVLKAVGTRSPVLIGARGIGKTAIVYELIRRSHAREPGSVPLLREARVVQLSLRAISARFKEKSDATNFFSELCDAIVAAPEPVVPFIRDVHLAYALDWEPRLHQLISGLDHPILAEGLPREFDQLLEYWTDLTEHLVAIPMQEPDQRKMRVLLEAWGAWTGEQTQRRFDEDAYRTALELTARFMGDRPFPRKAIDLLRQTVDFLGEEGVRPVTVRDVVRRFSQLTRVPPRLVDPDEQLDLTEVHAFVSERLLGQQEAVDAVVRMIALMKAGLADLRRPFGTFLFVGPTGVGKTWCAQLLAEYLFGERHRIVRINMAEYTEPHHALTVFGNPHAHSVVDQRGVLARRLQGNPFGVLLLDEFEKADPKVHDGFLQLFDEGRYINGRSEIVSVTSMIVIATSNAGAEVFRESGLGFERPTSLRELDRELDRRLHRTFRFELLNRFDRVVHFHPLDRACIRAIARRELGELAERDGLLGRGLAVEVDAEVLDWLVAHGYHPHWGARFLRREIERHVAGTLAEYIVREGPKRGSRLAIGVRHDRIEARTVDGPRRTGRDTPAGAPAARIPLEPEVLVSEARAWNLRFEPLIEESQTRRAQAALLVETSTTPGFWDDVENAQDVLRRYKTLDARLAADERLLGPVSRLKQVLAADDDLSPEELEALGFIGFEPGLPPSYSAPPELLDVLDEDARLEGLSVLVQLTAFPIDDLGGLGTATGTEALDFSLIEAGYKRLVVSEASTPNHNPQLTGLTIDRLAVPADVQTVRVEPNQLYELGILLGDELGRELYEFRNSEGIVEERIEEPYASWFSSGGEVVEPITLWPYMESTWLSPDEEGAEGTWYVVVRDRRGGMSWWIQDWQVGAP